MSQTNSSVYCGVEEWLQSSYPQLLASWRQARKNRDSFGNVENLCLICGIRKDSGVHYGIKICEADKQFLKRTFHDRLQYPDCRGSSPSPCPPRPRGWCQRCRLAACLATPLDISLVRVGRKLVKGEGKRGQEMQSKVEEGAVCLTIVPPDNLTMVPPVNLTMVPPVNLTMVPPDCQSADWFSETGELVNMQGFSFPLPEEVSLHEKYPGEVSHPEKYPGEVSHPEKYPGEALYLDKNFYQSQEDKYPREASYQGKFPGDTPLQEKCPEEVSQPNVYPEAVSYYDIYPDEVLFKENNHEIPLQDIYLRENQECMNNQVTFNMEVYNERTFPKVTLEEVLLPVSQHALGVHHNVSEQANFTRAPLNPTPLSTNLRMASLNTPLDLSWRPTPTTEVSLKEEPVLSTHGVPLDLSTKSVSTCSSSFAKSPLKTSPLSEDSCFNTFPSVSSVDQFTPSPNSMSNSSFSKPFSIASSTESLLDTFSSVSSIDLPEYTTFSKYSFPVPSLRASSLSRNSSLDTLSRMSPVDSLRYTPSPALDLSSGTNKFSVSSTVLGDALAQVAANMSGTSSLANLSSLSDILADMSSPDTSRCL